MFRRFSVSVAFCLVAIALILSLMPAAAGASPEVPSDEGLVPRDEETAALVAGEADEVVLPDGASEDWWSAVQEDIRQSEYEISWQESTYLPDLTSAYQAPNRAQNLRTYFTPGGIRVVPRSDAEPSWELGLTLSGYGYAGDVRPVAGAELAVAGHRAEYLRGDVSEWYVNGEAGLEQGFTLTSPPSGSGQGPQGGGDLVLEISLSGDLQSVLVDDGQAIEFLADSGARVLQYSDLRVTDAIGATLWAEMSLSEYSICFTMVAGSAVYPIYVDPLLSTPAWHGEGNQYIAYFGCSVGTAGDVNGDGYSDVIVGAEGYDAGQTDEGRAYVFHGSSTGLSTTSAWHGEGNQEYAFFGRSVGTAGDVNGDGYSDVIVGARGYDYGQTNEGRAYVFHGSSSGLSTTSAWHAEGNQEYASFGYSVGTAGDVNGDGYSDVIVGADGYSAGQIFEGRAYVFHGSSSGLSTTSAWRAEGNQEHAYFGRSVGTAGDVNGDGYSDVIVGADGYDAGQTDEGRAFVYYGNDGRGVSLRPRQLTTTISPPIAQLGRSDSPNAFRLGLTARTPFGRARVKLQCEVKPLGTPFDGTGIAETAQWASTDLKGTDLTWTIHGLSPNTVYHWRVRLRYHPATTPFQQYSRWLTIPWNGWQEADLRTAPSPNNPPVAVADSYSTNEDTVLNVAAPGVLSNDSDADGDPLTAIKVTNPSHGTVTLNSSGSLTYNPAANYNGTDTFTYKANDGEDDSNTVAVTVTVNAVNDAPSFIKGSNQTVLEDAGAQTVANWATAISAGPSDESGQSLNFIVSNNNNGLVSVPPAISASGTLTYTPAANVSGSATVTVIIHDNGGTANGGVDTSGTQSFTITVTAVNDPPVALADSYSTNEDTTLNVAAPGVLGNDPDIDSVALTAILVGNVSHGTLTLNSNGSFTYTPAANYNGTDSFTYKANDGEDDSNTVTVTITVGGDNDPPVAVADSYSTLEDTVLNVAAPGVLGNDSDEDGDPLTAIKATNPSHGTVTLNGNGSFTYTPAADYNGTDSFTYKANDGQADSSTVTVSITVVPVNDAPVAVADSCSTDEDTILNVMAPGVLANDTDAEGSPLTAVKVTDPSDGTLTLNSDGSFSYTPAANYNGTDSFTYKANDGDDDSNTVTVTITVGGDNDPPVALADSYSTLEDTVLNVAAPGVLGNDSDEDGDPLTAIKVTNPSHGTVTLNGNGSFTYTPGADYNGTDSFTYKANDGQDDSNTVTVTITVSSTPVAPVAAFSGSSTSGTAPLTVNFTNASTGTSPLTYAWDFDNNGTVDSTAQNPSYTYNSAGTYSVKLTVTNAAGSDDELRTDYIAVSSPPSVSTADATNIGTGSARLNGDLTSRGTASSVSLTFQWGTSSGSYTSETSPPQVEDSTGTFYFDLSGLSPGITYYFRAKAVGDGTTYGEEQQFTPATSSTPEPVLASVSPDLCCQGESVLVTLTGGNLADATWVGFGTGISVDSFMVDSPSQITAQITIEEDAAIGARDVHVTTPGGTCTLTAGFALGEEPSGGFPLWGWIVLGVGLAFLAALLASVLWRRRAAAS